MTASIGKSCQKADSVRYFLFDMMGILLKEDVVRALANKKSLSRTGLRSCPPPTPVFTGREDILSQMHAYFSGNVGRCHIFVLHGLGGARKSQISFKYVRSMLSPVSTLLIFDKFTSLQLTLFILLYQRFSDVFFVDASTVETITTDLRSIAVAKGVGNSENDALNWLSRQRKEWLLLFNSADDTMLNLRDYFPRCSHGNILITSRN